jgi:hypothetical protein
MHNSLAPLIAIAQPGISPLGRGIEANAGVASMKVHPCDASCKKGPPDASQNLEPQPQTIENQELATPSIITFTCREAHFAKKGLPMRLPISNHHRNPLKNRILNRHV